MSMRSFVIKFGCHALILVLLAWLPVEATLWRLGDNWSARTLTRRMGDRPYLFGSGYSQFAIRPFKFDMLKEARADVVSIGSSRVMQFREAAFIPAETGRTFYNAGGPLVGAPATFLAFARRMPVPYPKVVVLGIDTWSLSGEAGLSGKRRLLVRWGIYDSVKAAGRFAQDLAEGVRQQADGYHLFLRDFRRWTPLLFQAPLPTPVTNLWPVGAAARLAHLGFRNDGSYEYGRYVQQSAPASDWREALRRETAAARAEGRQPFGPWHGVGWGAWRDLEAAVALFRNNGARVVLLLPPYADPVMDVFDADPAYAGMRLSVAERLTALAATDPGVTFHDFSRPADAGCRPQEMYDFIHPSETCVARVTLVLAADPALKPYIDTSRLRAVLSGTPNPYHIFPPVIVSRLDESVSRR